MKRVGVRKIEPRKCKNCGATNVEYIVFHMDATKQAAWTPPGHKGPGYEIDSEVSCKNCVPILMAQIMKRNGLLEEPAAPAL